MANEFPFALSVSDTYGVALDGKSTLPALHNGGASYSRQSVDGAAAGRNQSGDMIRAKIAEKDKWALEFVPCTQSQLGALLGILDNEFFYLTYPDPLYGSGQTGHTNYLRRAKFYCSDRSAPILTIKKTGNRVVELWGNLKFNLIEK